MPANVQLGRGDVFLGMDNREFLVGVDRANTKVRESTVDLDRFAGSARSSMIEASFAVDTFVRSGGSVQGVINGFSSLAAVFGGIPGIITAIVAGGLVAWLSSVRERTAEATKELKDFRKTLEENREAAEQARFSTVSSLANVVGKDRPEDVSGLVTHIEALREEKKRLDEKTGAVARGVELEDGTRIRGIEALREAIRQREFVDDPEVLKRIEALRHSEGEGFFARPSGNIPDPEEIRRAQAELTNLRRDLKYITEEFESDGRRLHEVNESLGRSEADLARKMRDRLEAASEAPGKQTGTLEDRREALQRELELRKQIEHEVDALLQGGQIGEDALQRAGLTTDEALQRLTETRGRIREIQKALRDVAEAIGETEKAKKADEAATERYEQQISRMLDASRAWAEAMREAATAALPEYEQSIERARQRSEQLAATMIGRGVPALLAMMAAAAQLRGELGMIQEGRADSLKALEEQVALLGVSGVDRTIAQIEQRRRQMLEEAQRLGAGQDVIDRINRGLDDEIETARGGERRGGRFVDPVAFKREFQESLLKGGDDSGKRRDQLLGELNENGRDLKAIEERVLKQLIEIANEGLSSRYG